MGAAKKKGFYIAPETLTSMVERVKNGDSEAEAALHEACSGYVERYFRKKIQEEQDIKDLVEVTMYTAFKNINKLQEPTAFVRWLRCIAYRQCYHYYKKQENIVKLSLQDPDQAKKHIDGATPVNVKYSGIGEVGDKLRWVISELPKEQSIAMKLYYLDGYKVREIAEMRGVSTGTIKSRLRYGRIKLREKMGSYLDQHGIKL